MKKETIKQFLEFRKQFTPFEWHELNNAVDALIRKKAAKLELDDSDIQIIFEDMSVILRAE